MSRKYITKGKMINKDEWVKGDYLYNDRTKNHIIAVEKEEASKSADYGSNYDFIIVKPETVTLKETEK